MVAVLKNNKKISNALRHRQLPNVFIRIAVTHNDVCILLTICDYMSVGLKSMTHDEIKLDAAKKSLSGMAELHVR